MKDKLLDEAAQQNVLVYEKKMSPRIKGLYGDGVVWINRDLPTTAESTCVLAEELGHHHTTIGDILDQSSVSNRKQERKARQWAYRRLVPLDSIVAAYHARIKGRHEIAEFLGITESFLDDAINRYKEVYGVLARVDDRYAVVFDPLGVIELFEKD